MRSFPLPIRVAAGLATTVLEQTRELPKTLIGLPVTVTSQALQLSMRVQQQITELAIKGDQALSSMSQPEQQPEWATFDEDEPQPPKRAARTPRAKFDEADERQPKDESDQQVIAGYDQLTLPQLRGRLRRFSEDELMELLNYERAHGQRPDFERMLSNRINTVRSAGK